jgi:hypothetical protein
MASKPDRFKMTRGWDIEPHILLPSQMGPLAALSPEQRLCWAVMEGVIHDLGKPEKRAYKGRHHRTRPSLREEALHYIHATDRYWAFSFENVCQQIGVDPEAFRNAIEKKGQAA